jgi:hypothetical protein
MALNIMVMDSLGINKDYADRLRVPEYDMVKKSARKRIAESSARSLSSFFRLKQQGDEISSIPTPLKKSVLR